MKVCRSQVDACEREWVDPYLALLASSSPPRCRPPVLPRLDSCSLSSATVSWPQGTFSSGVGHRAANSSALAATSCEVEPICTEKLIRSGL